tara:strand:- start:64 stop:717 length:654 start_codon:yes stop_codon:yes gene_type:complete
MTIETLTQRVEVLEKQLLVLFEDKTQVKNPKKSKKDKADAPKVKRTSGYLQHNTARRAEVKARLEAGGAEKSKATEVTKELAIVWKALSNDEREVWNAKANAVKESWLNEAQAAVKHDVDEPELVEEEIDGEKPNKKEKKVKKEDKPKRVSGYILFQKAMREDAVKTLNDALEEDGSKIKQSDVMKELGRMWKALEDDERKEWNDKAAEQKASDSEE